MSEPAESYRPQVERPQLYLGVDIGVSGAIALIDWRGACLQVEDMPCVTRGSGKGQQVSGADLAHLLRGWQQRGILHATIEAVSARPGQGVTSMFSFGRSAGLVEGVVATLGISAIWVLPQQWKRAHGLLKAEKDASRR